jgi:hypothetical protein
MEKIFSKKTLPLKIILFLGSFFMTALAGSTQGIIQADVSVTSTTLIPEVGKREGSTETTKISFGDLKCTITLHNEGGYSYQTMLVVQLPAGVSIVSNLNNSTTYSSGNGRGGWPGSLLFNVGTIGSGQDKVIEFTITRSQYANTIAAYVFSGATDPKPSNNFKEASYRF